MQAKGLVGDPKSLQDRLGYVFRDPSLLRLALTHPSRAHEAGGETEHNQRLEFLGDAVLQLVLTDELYHKFPKVDEGLLTKARAEMVNRKALAGQGQSLGLGDHLHLSRGEESTGGRRRPSTLADAFEALVGSIYLDGGLAPAREFIWRQFREVFGELEVIPNLENPKGELQEMLQSRSCEPPSYRLEHVSGPDHERVFQSAVFHQGTELGRGQGQTKKESESEAARAALARLRREALPTPGSAP